MWRRLRLAALGAWVLSTLLLGSDAGFSIVAFILALYGGLLLVGVWLARFVWSFRNRRRSGASEPLPLRQSLIKWIWEPVTIVIVCMLVLTAALFPLRFALSRPALERYVTEIQQRGDSLPPTGQIVGLFRM